MIKPEPDTEPKISIKERVQRTRLRQAQTQLTCLIRGDTCIVSQWMMGALMALGRESGVILDIVHGKGTYTIFEHNPNPYLRRGKR